MSNRQEKPPSYMEKYKKTPNNPETNVLNSGMATQIMVCESIRNATKG